MGTGKSKIKYKTYIKDGWVIVYIYDKKSSDFIFHHKYKPGTGIEIYADGSISIC